MDREGERGRIIEGRKDFMRVAAQLCHSRRMSCHAFVDTSPRRDLVRFVRVHTCMCMCMRANINNSYARTTAKVAFPFQAFSARKSVRRVFEILAKVSATVRPLRSLSAHHSANEGELPELMVGVVLTATTSGS